MKVPGAQRVRHSTLAAGLRDVVWTDIREGLPRLQDLSAPTRVLGIIGILAIGAAMLQLLFVDSLRTQAALLAGHGDLGGRAQLVPLTLLPLSLATLVVAWTFLLSGSARAHPLVMAPVLMLFAATTVVWISGNTLATTPVQRGVPTAALVSAVALALAARRARPRLEFLMFCLLLACVALAYGATPRVTGGVFDAVAVETPIITLGLLLSLARGLALPLLVVLGFGLAVFAYRAASWIADTALGAAHGWALPVAVIALALGTVVSAGNTISSAWREATPGSWLGALLFVVLPFVAGAAATRWRRDTTVTDLVDEADLIDAADRVIPTIALAFFAPMVVVTIGMLLASAAGGVVQLGGGLRLPSGTDAALTRAAEWVTSSAGPYRVVFVVGAAIAGLVLLPRRPTLGVYLLVLGAAHGWVASVSSGPLVMLRWDDDSQVAVWLAVGVLTKLAVDLRTRGLDRDGQRNYVLALGIVVLFGQVGLLENPFHPVFAFTGVALVTAALAVDTLTVGSWANHDTPRLPRASRLLLYVGYALFSLTLVTWAAGTHDFVQLELYTGEAAIGGLRLFGDPLLLTLVAVLVIARPVAAASQVPAAAGDPDPPH